MLWMIYHRWVSDIRIYHIETQLQWSFPSVAVEVDEDFGNALDHYFIVPQSYNYTVLLSSNYGTILGLSIIECLFKETKNFWFSLFV